LKLPKFAKSIKEHLSAYVNLLDLQPSDMEPPRNADSVLDLPDDLAEEILFRLPPIEPACLVRASLVSKPWRRLISSACFLRRYRVFHRTPPMLGVIHTGGEISDHDSRFVPTISRSPVDPADLNWCPLDCRHGRALFSNHTLWRDHFSLVVWDPMTDGRHDLHEPCIPYTRSTAAVLCAVGDDCDHLACQGGPFLVVFVGTDDTENITRACVYSSETGEWSAPASVHLNCNIDNKPSVLVEGGVYFLCYCGNEIIRYDVAKHVLTVVDRPSGEYNDIVLVAAVDGGLAFVGLDDGVLPHLNGLYVWSKEAVGWVRRVFIDDLRGRLIPSQNPVNALGLLGSAEGSDSILFDTGHGVFSIDLRSGKVGKKICERGNFYAIFPYMSFCTPGKLRYSGP
jgi:hypothetical protein